MMENFFILLRIHSRFSAPFPITALQYITSPESFKQTEMNFFEKGPDVMHFISTEKKDYDAYLSNYNQAYSGSFRAEDVGRLVNEGEITV